MLMPVTHHSPPTIARSTTCASGSPSWRPTLERPDAWPAEQLRLCGEAGVFEWFVEPELGGQGWSEAEVLRGYVKLAAACLTTTFVITQRTGAMSRIAASENDCSPRGAACPT